MTAPEVVEALLLSGLDDWIYLAEVVSTVRSVEDPETEEALVDEVISTIEQMLDDGLLKIGDVTDGGFFEWDLPVDAALERVKREWGQLGTHLSIGDVCWLATTPEGDRRAIEILKARERRESV